MLFFLFYMYICICNTYLLSRVFETTFPDRTTERFLRFIKPFTILAGCPSLGWYFGQFSVYRLDRALAKLTRITQSGVSKLRTSISICERFTTFTQIQKCQEQQNVKILLLLTYLSKDLLSCSESNASRRMF